MVYDLIMIVTFIDNQSIGCMLKSVINSNQNIKALIILVNQLDILIDIDNANEHVHIKCIYPQNGLLSLSRARNIALEYIKNNKIISHHVMFPDDDSTFDNTFFDVFRDAIKVDHNYVIGVYNAGTRDYYSYKLKNNQKLTKKDFKAAISVNMVIAYETLFKIGKFDESLGVGTRFGSAEDHDYYLRACNVTCFQASSKIFNYHPSANTLYDNYSLIDLLSRGLSYSRGYIYVMFRHKLFGAALGIVTRALCASGYFLVKLQFKRCVANFVIFFIRLYHFVYFLSNYNRYFSIHGS